MASDKKHKQLLNRLKKREKKGIAKPIVVKPLTMKSGERNKFTNNNAMVLLAIERTIIALADDHVSLDDRAVRSALASSIHDCRSQGKLASDDSNEMSSAVATKDGSDEVGLVEQLSANFRKRYDTFFPANARQATETWEDGMRAIYTSATAVSDFAPGECSYIQSARSFLANAQSG